ncbi:MAG TPA: chemotaxis protein CheX [Gemmatimonadaceae bacterium]|nr:chemotaxis protein CheX [Gemmatimonadaceae bacterium]
MSAHRDVVLRTAATRAFEELGLLCVRQEGPPPRVSGALRAGAEVSFTGSLEGHLILRVSRGVLDAITANMLGREGPHSASLRSDALGELANVICGSALAGCVGPSARLSLGPPARIGAGRSTEERRPLYARASLDLEAGRADVRLYAMSA